MITGIIIAAVLVGGVGLFIGLSWELPERNLKWK